MRKKRIILDCIDCGVRVIDSRDQKFGKLDEIVCPDCTQKRFPKRN